eukprot:TRINITY_DN733_c0_g1_i1.p3 TRINITY_DN733_c0_g1~~TRINITY_DN733_c0_g1_i1.p3  ORF type:complete len:275 (+),score=161.52 TRINITY_DN733_c0_g1_i1:59-883(+)
MLRTVALGCLLLAAASGADAAGKAKASHILMKDEDALMKVKDDIDAGKATFVEMAKKHSTCPSKNKGGDLGSFGKGAMVKEFEEVVFADSTEVGKVYGPVKTQFGFHLIRVTERDGKKAPEDAEGEKKEKKKKKKKQAPAMISISTQADFREKVLNHQDAFAVEFYSAMCGSCKEFSPIWDAYAKKTPPVRTAKVNIDDKGAMDVAQALGVMEEGIPNVRVFTGADEKGVSILQGNPLSIGELTKKIKEATSDLGKKSKKTGVVKKKNAAAEEL